MAKKKQKQPRVVQNLKANQKAKRQKYDGPHPKKRKQPATLVQRVQEILLSRFPPAWAAPPSESQLRDAYQAFRASTGNEYERVEEHASRRALH